MSTTWVTRCPQCATAFRLNRQQLTAAAGSVRCGACLKVFKAQEHLVKGSAPLPEELQPQEAQPAPETAIKEPHQASEAPAQPKPKADAKPDPEFSDAFQALSEAGEQQHDHFTPEPQPSTAPDGADESWAEAMLAELEQESGATEQQESKASASSARKEPADRSETVFQKPQPAEQEADADTEKAASESAAQTQEQMQQQWLQDIEPEPIDLQPVARRRVGVIIGWSLLNLLIALLLVGQYSYFNFDRLARDDRWRPAFALACGQLNCTLPGIQDLSQIKSANLVVRSHERYENALTVDAVIYNTAAHAQPFPNIELLFADLNNEPVASRVFTPLEYLGGELAGEALMPSNTPIYLALEIQDPGSGALNYQLSFQPTGKR